jgi:hypothetical protein
MVDLADLPQKDQVLIREETFWSLWKDLIAILFSTEWC